VSSWWCESFSTAVGTVVSTRLGLDWVIPPSKALLGGCGSAILSWPRVEFRPLRVVSDEAVNGWTTGCSLSGVKLSQSRRGDALISPRALLALSCQSNTIKGGPTDCSTAEAAAGPHIEG